MQQMFVANLFLLKIYTLFQLLMHYQEAISVAIDAANVVCYRVQTLFTEAKAASEVAKKAETVIINLVK